MAWVGVLIHWGNEDWVFGEGLEGKVEGMRLEEHAWLRDETDQGDDDNVKRRKKKTREKETYISCVAENGIGSYKEKQSRQRREPI